MANLGFWLQAAAAATTLPNVGPFSDQSPLAIAGLSDLNITTDTNVSWTTGIHAYNHVTLASGVTLRGVDYGVILWCNTLTLNGGTIAAYGDAGFGDGGGREGQDGGGGAGGGGGGGAAGDTSGGQGGNANPGFGQNGGNGDSIDDPGGTGGLGIATINPNYSGSWGTGGPGSYGDYTETTGPGIGGYGGGGGQGGNGFDDPEELGVGGGGGGGGLVLIVCNQILFSQTISSGINVQGADGGTSDLGAQMAGGGGGGVSCIWTKKYTPPAFPLNVYTSGGYTASPGSSQIFEINSNLTTTLKTFSDSWNNP